MPALLQFLLHTTAGLLVRIATGAAILGTLAYIDWRRRGPAATRWREYVFLMAAAGVALLYGLVNDQITVTISWEYFYYGKGLDEVLGPLTPPGAGALRWEAAKIGLKSAWSAGLLAGVFLLIANNPRSGRPQLPMRRLYRMLPWLFVATAAGAVLGGCLGHLGLLANADLLDLQRQNLWRPGRFMGVYGAHLGAYVGGLAGAIVAAVRILIARSVGRPPGA